MNVPEKAVERMCDELVQKMGGSVVRFSQARATNQTLGIPDRRYCLHGVRFWFECKSSEGKLTREQFAFLMSETGGGWYALCGGLDELRGMIDSIRKHDRGATFMYTQRVLEQWQNRGFRGERKPSSEKAT